MKVIIDVIEDIRAAIDNDESFSLAAMGLKEQRGEFVPSWESRLCSMRLDDEKKRLFLFLGKEKALNTGELLRSLNILANEKMMYAIYISYSKDDARRDSPLLGFGESLPEKKYVLFIAE